MAIRSEIGWTDGGAVATAEFHIHSRTRVLNRFYFVRFTKATAVSSTYYMEKAYISCVLYLRLKFSLLCENRFIARILSPSCSLCICLCLGLGRCHSLSLCLSYDLSFLSAWLGIYERYTNTTAEIQIKYVYIFIYFFFRCCCFCHCFFRIRSRKERSNKSYTKK